MANTQTTYLSPLAEKQPARRKRFLISGIILTVFFGFGVIGGITGQTEGLRQGLTVYLVFLIPSLLLIWKGVSIGKRMDAARRYNSIFLLDTDGFVTLEELTRCTGQTAGAVQKELELLFRKGYFQSCAFRQGDGVILSSAVGDRKEEGFVMVRCPNCGAASRIRAGTTERCPYCGGPVSQDR